ncbi:hypothetical protein N7456_002863 [Penicillium angulare]|uniref:Uncharacterized protein n=1 Tax=Penicillium angulare TaxID=116970 RepID=A0A9W9FTP2_9EURO|nr:hypothetical protein N7456_002863 [Penicillium angulare]
MATPAQALSSPPHVSPNMPPFMGSVPPFPPFSAPTQQPYSMHFGPPFQYALQPSYAPQPAAPLAADPIFYQQLADLQREIAELRRAGEYKRNRRSRSYRDYDRNRRDHSVRPMGTATRAATAVSTRGGDTRSRSRSQSLDNFRERDIGHFEPRSRGKFLEVRDKSRIYHNVHIGRHVPPVEEAGADINPIPSLSFELEVARIPSPFSRFFKMATFTEKEVKKLMNDCKDKYSKETQTCFKDLFRGKLEEEKRSYQTLAIATLPRPMVEEYLVLRHVTTADDELKNVPSVATPEELKNILEMIRQATGKSDTGESTIQISINMLLVYAHDAVVSSNSPGARSICIQTEKTWSYPFIHQNKRYKLVGKPDYAVWYGEIEEIALNVVICEAKRFGHTSSGFSQCLAYMGIVHRLRKDAEKSHCAVYGVVSDAEDFVCMKINNNSEWSDFRLHSALDARNGNHDVLLGLLVHFMKKAALLSPVHSKELSGQTHSKGSYEYSIFRGVNSAVSDSEMEEEDSDDEGCY